MENNKIVPYEKFKERLEEKERNQIEFGEKISQSFSQFLLLSLLFESISDYTEEAKHE